MEKSQLVECSVVQREEGLSFTIQDASPTYPHTQRPVSSSAALLRSLLQTHTPTELECIQSNGALCFINPLFIKVHQPEGSKQCTNFNTPETPREESNKTTNAEHPQICRSDHSDRNQSARKKLPNLCRNSPSNVQINSSQKLGAGASVPRFPPSHPSLPCFTAQCSAPPVQQRSMPEKIAWINEPKAEEVRQSRPFSRLGSTVTTGLSSSPSKRFSISSLASIPRQSLPLSLMSLSSSPSRSKASSLSSDYEDAQCHLALEEKTIETAIRRSQLFRQNAIRSTAQDVYKPSKTILMPANKRAENLTGEVPEGCSGTSQRLSDMSLSTDSSDSLDFSQSSGFLIPPLHDPSPPTMADFDNHLPLSLPPSHLRLSNINIDDEDDDDEDEEDPIFGISLESDQEQDQDLTMLPPGSSTRRRSSTSAVVLQKALRGNLRKMSGVFTSLLTPEKRAVRKVRELSRDKNSYFGSLVQEYLSYMNEGAGAQAWQSYTSCLELLQTVRQFITQMKSYLRQSSEMEPSIDSLVPEDQIDQVLEKAMLKCVLKPLKPVLSAALHEFQERSGALQELKENLCLYKARLPQEIGVTDALPPDSVAIEKIKKKFEAMCKLYNPEKKVTILLQICKLIYTIMEDNSGRLYGADDFLPMLTYVLAQCDMPGLDTEILYMMELLDPSLLHGEGDYYLTTAYGAMSLIKNFKEDQAARVLSSETKDTLRQWHRRRTTQRSAPSIDDFQNYLRVALQELNSGCTAKTLQVRPHATVEDVCQLCALKFRVSDPENYGLFLQMEGSSQQLAPDTHPQKIKAELHSRPEATSFLFVYRRVANSSSHSSPTPNLNHLASTPDPTDNLNCLSTNLSGPSSESGVGSDLSPPPSHLSDSVSDQERAEA
ncbi:ras and Rab interactor 2 [Austrofundulus limnaeus]|uniref:Ras and Rab interactor 2 n=1 Tax=Austrofundulus limnaeus TaxID=52670 RepID=A0A2I4C6J5_AUSLI|nr:PREDICTED: ras and Rab interactor 2-like [Austrofundulus limnaeus]